VARTRCVREPLDQRELAEDADAPGIGSGARKEPRRCHAAAPKKRKGSRESKVDRPLLSEAHPGIAPLTAVRLHQVFQQLRVSMPRSIALTRIANSAWLTKERLRLTKPRR